MSTSAELTRDVTSRPPEPEVRLRRVLGLPALVFFGLAYMVPLACARLPQAAARAVQRR